MELQAKNLGSPEETRPFTDKGKLDVVKLGDVTVGRGVFEPGWKWSEHVKPLAQTDSCESTHLGYMVSGRMKIVMDDGTETEAGPGDAVSIPPGHDAWIVGDKTCVFIDFQGFAEYARK